MRRKGHVLINTWKYNDGGRSKYGFKGRRDCVVRAIAIATGKSYKRVHNDLKKLIGKNPSTGCSHSWAKYYLHKHGWIYEPFPSTSNETFQTTYLPKRCIVTQVRHYTSVVGGVLNDSWNALTHDSGRPRKILGYYYKPVKSKPKTIKNIAA